MHGRLASGSSPSGVRHHKGHDRGQDAGGNAYRGHGFRVVRVRCRRSVLLWIKSVVTNGEAFALRLGTRRAKAGKICSCVGVVSKRDDKCVGFIFSAGAESGYCDDLTLACIHSSFSLHPDRLRVLSRSVICSLCIRLLCIVLPPRLFHGGAVTGSIEHLARSFNQTQVAHRRISSLSIFVN